VSEGGCVKRSMTWSSFRSSRPNSPVMPLKPDVISLRRSSKAESVYCPLAERERRVVEARVHLVEAHVDHVEPCIHRLEARVDCIEAGVHRLKACVHPFEPSLDRRTECVEFVLDRLHLRGKRFQRVHHRPAFPGVYLSLGSALVMPSAPLIGR
jgi:hypothetical protein